jgi:hypothetical protein
MVDGLKLAKDRINRMDRISRLGLGFIQSSIILLILSGIVP